MRGDEAHGGKADQHRTENAQRRSQIELVLVVLDDVAADRGFSVGTDPAGFTPAHEVAVEALGIA